MFGRRRHSGKGEDRRAHLHLRIRILIIINHFTFCSTPCFYSATLWCQNQDTFSPRHSIKHLNTLGSTAQDGWLGGRIWEVGFLLSQMMLHLDLGAVATLNWMARWPRRALEEKCPEGSSTLTSGQTQAGWQDIWGARSVSKVILFVVCTSPPLLRQTSNFRWSCIFIKTTKFVLLLYYYFWCTSLYSLGWYTNAYRGISFFALWPWGD